MQSTQQKVAIITGAGAGIGRATAVRLASTGYRVVVADVTPGAADRVCENIAGGEENALPCVCDVATESGCNDMAEVAVNAWGRIDVLVANAGIQVPGTLLETVAQDWDRIIAVNFRGVANSCKAVLPVMLQQHQGAIVINSSVNALLGSKGMTVYDMTKAGVLGLMRSLAAEYGRQGVRVNAVCPGNTITDFHINNFASQGITVDQIRELTADYGLLGRAAEPEEIASAISFLAGDDASFITGHTLVVDGGHSVT